MTTDQTATVSHLHPPVVHFDVCEREVYGAAVMQFLATGAPGDSITAQALRDYARGWREIRPCGCLAVRVRATTDALILARRAARKDPSEVNTDRVDALIALRKQLRGMA